MHKSKRIIISSFYKFVYLSSPQKLKIKLLKNLKKLNIKGTIIIGNEGINGSFSVDKKHLDKAFKIIQDSLPIKLEYKSQTADFHPFLRLKIKLKKEIVTLGKENIDPALSSASYLNSTEWDALLQNSDSIIIDTRNHYESDVGSFKSSIKTSTRNFREFPQWISKNKEKLKNKKIGMFCTGGIRCEKASNYLLNIGFKNVFQLKGGILEYLRKTENSSQLWEGECFVFDNRVTVDKSLKRGTYSQCYACRSPISKEEVQSKHYKPGISCPKCAKEKSLKQIKKYKERQKQILIAKKKKINHLGS